MQKVGALKKKIYRRYTQPAAYKPAANAKC